MAPWRANRASEPVSGPSTPVLVMGQLRNRFRHFVDGDGPLAPGFVAVGDALYHSNPIYGRGCPSALMTVELLDEAVGRHPDDPIAMARHYHATCETHVRPFWEAAVASDRRMLGERRALASSNRRRSCRWRRRRSAGSSIAASSRRRASTRWCSAACCASSTCSTRPRT
jgi:flavin-dependent dehydrogenase